MGRRIKNVRVSGLVLAQLCAGMEPGRWVRWDGGVPADAKYVGASYDHNSDCVVVTFEHESFPEVFGGDVVPLADGPTVTATTAADLAAEYRAWAEADAERHPLGLVEYVPEAPALSPESERLLRESLERKWADGCRDNLVRRRLTPEELAKARATVDALAGEPDCSHVVLGGEG